MSYPIIPPFGGIDPVTRITPFTMRAGSTFLKVLEELSKYVSEMAEQENDAHRELLAKVDSAITEAINTVNAAIAELLENSLEVNDAIVSTLVEKTDSLLRKALDNVYATLDNVVLSVAGKKGVVELQPRDVGGSTANTDNTTPVRFEGRLPGIGNPTAPGDAVNLSTLSAKLSDAVEALTLVINGRVGEALELIGATNAELARVDAQLSAVRNSMLTDDDTIFTALIPSVRADGAAVVDAPHAHYSPLFVAPFPLEIVSASLAVYEEPNAPTSTTWPKLALRRFRAGAGAMIVEIAADQNKPLKRQTAWDFDGGVWNPANRVLAPGDILGFGMSMQGAYTFKYAAAVTVRYRRMK